MTLYLCVINDVEDEGCVTGLAYLTEWHLFQTEAETFAISQKG